MSPRGPSTSMHPSLWVERAVAIAPGSKFRVLVAEGSPAAWRPESCLRFPSMRPGQGSEAGDLPSSASSNMQSCSGELRDAHMARGQGDKGCHMPHLPDPAAPQPWGTCSTPAWCGEALAGWVEPEVGRQVSEQVDKQLAVLYSLGLLACQGSWQTRVPPHPHIPIGGHCPSYQGKSTGGHAWSCPPVVTLGATNPQTGPVCMHSPLLPLYIILLLSFPLYFQLYYCEQHFTGAFKQ